MKRPTPVQRSCGRVRSGDTEISRTQVAADVDRLRQLTAGLISAIAQAGNLFAQRHVGKFSVANIEAYADKMPGMLVGKEVKCWRQYKELATRHGCADDRKGNSGRHRGIHRNAHQRPQPGLST